VWINKIRKLKIIVTVGSYNINYIIVTVGTSNKLTFVTLGAYNRRKNLDKTCHFLVLNELMWEYLTEMPYFIDAC